MPAEPVRTPEPEVLRDGRYVLVRQLGEGSQGATFEAVDKRDGRLVAIKRFAVKGAHSWKDVELAEREARVLAELDHPALPRHLEHFEENGCLYLVMDRIEGESLLAKRKRGASMSEDDVWAFLEASADVLDYLHGRSPPVIHRDIKPGNVIERPDGSFAFVDFGSVRDRLKPEGGSTVVGTFGYMAPEQFQGRALPGSDVYAVGATALCMLTGVEPEELPHKGLAIDVARALGGRGDPALVALLAAMLEPDPDRRPGRIGPLLGAHDREWPRTDPPRSSRKERRRERHRQRRERRAERRSWRALGVQPGPAHLLASPFFLSAVLTLLWLVRIAIWALWEVALPVFLGVLSIVLGAPLRRAARGSTQVGRRGRAQVRATARRLRASAERAAAERYLERVSATPQPRVRVESDVPEAHVRVEDDAAREEPVPEPESSREVRRAVR